MTQVTSHKGAALYKNPINIQYSTVHLPEAVISHTDGLYTVTSLTPLISQSEQMDSICFCFQKQLHLSSLECSKRLLLKPFTNQWMPEGAIANSLGKLTICQKKIIWNILTCNEYYIIMTFDILFIYIFNRKKKPYISLSLCSEINH